MVFREKSKGSRSRASGEGVFAILLVKERDKNKAKFRPAKGQVGDCSSEQVTAWRKAVAIRRAPRRRALKLRRGNTLAKLFCS